jgi:2-polyprenyl-3-methyl-5-hydroxy-6-metoxy-1,4-benzoquinol methylase
MDALLKQRAKQLVRRTIGEPYVGKRLKQRRVAGVLDGLTLNPRAILDAGTEDATFVYWLADRFPSATVTAVDLDTEAIAACVSARPPTYANRVKFETTAFADLPPEAFDLITILDVFEHIREDQQAAKDLAAALRPDGTLLAHVPRDRWRTLGGTIHQVADEDAWKINGGHVRAGYSPESMQALLTGAGLRIEQIETWLGPWGVVAHSAYARLEHPTALRLLSIPVTDACAYLDARKPRPGGNTVFARAVKP